MFAGQPVVLFLVQRPSLRVYNASVPSQQRRFKQGYAPPSNRTWSKLHHKYRYERPLVQRWRAHALLPHLEWWRGQVPAQPTFIGHPDVVAADRFGGGVREDRMNGTVLAETMRRYVTHNLHDPHLWNSLIARCGKIASSLHVDTLCHVTETLSLASSRPSRLAALLVGQVQDRQKALRPHNLVTLFRAARNGSRCDFPDRELENIIVPLTIRLVLPSTREDHYCTPQNTAGEQRPPTPQAERSQNDFGVLARPDLRPGMRDSNAPSSPIDDVTLRERVNLLHSLAHHLAAYPSKACGSVKTAILDGLVSIELSNDQLPLPESLLMLRTFLWLAWCGDTSLEAHEQLSGAEQQHELHHTTENRCAARLIANRAELSSEQIALTIQALGCLRGRSSSWLIQDLSAQVSRTGPLLTSTCARRILHGVAEAAMQNDIAKELLSLLTDLALQERITDRLDQTEWMCWVTTLKCLYETPPECVDPSRADLAARANPFGSHWSRLLKATANVGEPAATHHMCSEDVAAVMQRAQVISTANKERKG